MDNLLLPCAILPTLLEIAANIGLKSTKNSWPGTRLQNGREKNLNILAIPNSREENLNSR